MRFHINLFSIILVIILISNTSAVEKKQETAITNFPYTAEITANNVYIRSGPGTAYYSCGKLNKGDKVKIVDVQFSWSRITPPPGSFSWISKNYVDTSAAKPGTGIVTGDSVRVYAGSKERKAIQSENLQTKRNKGDIIKLLGDEEDGFYKIEPPSGAYLWVKTEYTKSIPDSLPIVTTVKPKAGEAPLIKEKTPAEDKKEEPFTGDKELRDYKAIEKQIKAEKAKPITSQDYTKIKRALSAIINNDKNSKSARYSKFALDQITSYELAAATSKALELQEQQLQKVRDGIEKARDVRIKKMPKLGRFAVIGKLQKSKVYSDRTKQKYYTIVNGSGKIICYARPSSAALSNNLDKLIGHKVGLVGEIQSHTQTSGALVEVKRVVALKE